MTTFQCYLVLETRWDLFLQDLQRIAKRPFPLCQGLVFDQMAESRALGPLPVFAAR